MQGIYSITDKTNGKSYIGQSVNIEKRFLKHQGYLKNNYHPNQHLQNAYKKHGKDSFEYKVLRECSTEELDVWERIFIRFFDSLKNGYNKASGGNKFKTFSDESKEKMSLSQKGNTKSKGRIVSKETRDKISVANKGTKPSDLAIKRMIETHKGVPLSKEHREKISKALKGRRLSEQHKQSLRKPKA